MNETICDAQDKGRLYIITNGHGNTPTTNYKTRKGICSIELNCLSSPYDCCPQAHPIFYVILDLTERNNNLKRLSSFHSTKTKPDRT